MSESQEIYGPKKRRHPITVAAGLHRGSSDVIEASKTIRDLYDLCNAQAGVISAANCIGVDVKKNMAAMRAEVIPSGIDPVESAGSGSGS